MLKITQTFHTLHVHEILFAKYANVSCSDQYYATYFYNDVMPMPGRGEVIDPSNESSNYAGEAK